MTSVCYLVKHLLVHGALLWSHGTAHGTPQGPRAQGAGVRTPWAHARAPMEAPFKMMSHSLEGERPAPKHHKVAPLFHLQV